jgi:FKBP-type peptidyl-prolyl cis-trans isomerase
MNKYFLIVVLGFALSAWACNKKDDTSEKLAAEEQKLTEYMESTVPDAKKLANGLYVKKLTEITNVPKPEAGKYALVDYTVKWLYNDQMEHVSYKDYESFQPIYLPLYKDGGPILWQMTAPLNGISAGIGELCEGETANIYFASRYNSDFLPPPPDFTTRLMWVKLVKVINDLTLYQESLMSEYLKQAGGETDTVKVKSSLDFNDYNIMYAIEYEGNGAQITDADAVATKTSLSYLLQEYNMAHEYLAAQDVSWQTGSTSTGGLYTATNAMSEILTKMKKGGRVTVAMPYKLFYGDPAVDAENMPIPRDGETQQFAVPIGSVVILNIAIED